MAVEPSPSAHLIASAELIKQGAEARVYLLPSILPTPLTFTPSSSSSSSSSASSLTAAAPQGVILKHRFPKTYRHPTLNANLTKTRLSYEARALSRCQRAGVVVPSVLWVDEAGGTLGLERIDGWSVREILGGGAEGEVEVVDEEEVEIHGSAEASGAADTTTTRTTSTSTSTTATTDGGSTERTDGMSEDMQGLQVDGAQGVEPVDEEEVSEGLMKLREVGVTPEHLMSSIGTALARLHSTITTHGDLTTSNMMVRLTPGKAQPYEVVLIDFGLASGAQYAEHYAVDLYVLERAFASTHPASEKLYAGVLEAYGVGMGKKWKDIEKKLAEDTDVNESRSAHRRRSPQKRGELIYTPAVGSHAGLAQALRARRASNQGRFPTKVIVGVYDSTKTVEALLPRYQGDRRTEKI